MREPRKFAGVLLLTKKGELILQRRDDFPTIVDPGLLSIFAGRMQEGETPREAAVRVITSETSLTLNPEQLTTGISFTKTADKHGSDGVSHIFICADIDPATLTTYQGQGHEVIAYEDLDKHDTAPISYDILMSLKSSLQ